MADSDEKKEDLYKKISESKTRWTALVRTLSHKLKTNDLKDVYDIQADSISYRQEVVDEIHTYAIKIHRLVQKLKVLNKAKFEFYATSYPVKTSGTEKLRLIEYDMSEYQCFINELDEYVNFLRDTAKDFESINYSVKGRVEVENYLRGYK